MKIKNRHRWEVSPRQAAILQEELATRVIGRGRATPRWVAGCDVAYSADGRRGWGAVILLIYPSLEVVEERIAEGEVRFPYIPGLLSFREGPLLLKAFSRLRGEPDLVFFDGHGLAHPRRFGLASHLGLWLERPSIGCAKSRYIGTYEEPGRERGARTPLMAAGGEVIGAVLRTRTGVKPVFVSAGHLIDLDEAVRFTLEVSGRYRLPRPIRLAHNLLSGKKSRKKG